MVDDDVSGDTMLVIDESNGGGAASSFWIADDAGLGTDYIVVTSAGDRIVWSS